MEAVKVFILLAISALYCGQVKAEREKYYREQPYTSHKPGQGYRLHNDLEGLSINVAQIQVPHQIPLSQSQTKYVPIQNSGRDDVVDDGGGQIEKTKKKHSRVPGNSPGKGTTKQQYESESDIQAGGRRGVGNNEDWKGSRYEFKYGVKDDKGNDYTHKSEGDGDVVKGEYRTLMPDGRMQVVSYTADWKKGYRATVKYLQGSDSKKV